MNDDTEVLVDALRPFARYAEQMAQQWGHHGNSAFYGVKRGYQITYGDFRLAAAVVRDMEATAMSDPSLGWWQVITGGSIDSQAGDEDLGTFYGYVDEIALALADKAWRPWSDSGKLTFTKVAKPAPPQLPSTTKKKHVFIEVTNWEPERRVMAEFFANRNGVQVEDGSPVYGSVKISRSKRGKADD